MSWTEIIAVDMDRNGASQKKYYKIKDVSEMLDIPTSTIRFWEKEFEELTPRRSKTNIRYYTPADVETLRLINYLTRIRGLRLEAAREQLATNAANVSKRVELISRLKEVREELEALKAALVKRRGEQD